MLSLSEGLFAQGKITRPQKQRNPIQYQHLSAQDSVINNQSNANILPNIAEPQSNNPNNYSRSNSRSFAPELHCSVRFNTDYVLDSEKPLFNKLQESIERYMNNTTFTDARFSDDERIDCNLIFTVTDYDESGKVFGNLQIQSFRPVYGSTYKTPLLDFKDYTVLFKYHEGDLLLYSEDSTTNKLTDILNFYAYLIIALDFDSFALNGGESYWKKVQMIQNRLQSSQEIICSDFDDNSNRIAILKAFNKPGNPSIHQLYFSYHRQGLDEMAQSRIMGRKNVTESIYYLKKVYENDPTSIALRIFRDTKFKELTDIYRYATDEECKKVYNLLQLIFPYDYGQLESIQKAYNK